MSSAAGVCSGHAGCGMTDPRIVLIAFPDVQILDVTGPLEVFSCATRFVPGAAYELQVASHFGGA
ncbi:MAG: hypothetical protein QOE84_547, partial [Actinomycetota bacterium]|nr:hypothetical protein [Actinomycetota bacterium]